MMSNTQKCERANQLFQALKGISAPPEFAKALHKTWMEMKDFVKEFNPDDEGQRSRFFAKLSDIEWVVKDMKTAYKEAFNSKKFPMVMIPSGLWKEILGKEHTKAQAGEHWPLPKADGPITWKD